MKTIHSAILSSLPDEVKSLVRSGVYTLYTVKNGPGAYLLVTNRNEFYLLSPQGEPIGGITTLGDIALDDVVAFSDPAAPDSLAQNWI